MAIPGEDDPQLVAKLRGLERMLLAGLIDEATYQVRHARLQAELAASRGGGSASTLPPVPEAPAPAPLIVSAPAAASEHLEPVSLAAVLEPPPPAQARRIGPPGPRGVLIATAVLVGIIAGGTAAIIAATRSHSSSDTTAHATPRNLPTGTPDAATILAGLRTAAPSLPDVVMDASDAETLVRAYWPARERALADHDRLAVRELETGAAAQWDGVGCTVGCAPPSPRTIEDLNLFVPRQTAYPAAFMAEVLTTQFHSSGHMVEIMVFNRPSKQQPWSLALDTGYTGADHLGEFPVPVEGGAFDADAPAVPGVDQPGLPRLFAAYLQHWIDHASAPANTPLGAGPFTTAVGQALHEQTLEDRARGIADTVAYTADPTTDGVWTFAVKEEQSGAETRPFAMTCGTVRYTASAVSTRSGGTLVQDQGFSPFGTLLAPGGYASVTEQGLHQNCFVSAAGVAQIIVAGNNGSAVAVSGAIAHAPT